MDKRKEIIFSAVDKVLEAQSAIIELKKDGIINRGLFLSVYGKIMEGRNYLVGYAESIREEK